jgi:hypothetical protein
MCSTVLSPVGGSSVPAAMLIVSASGADQNRLDPHSPQKPRRARVLLSGLSIQRSRSSPVSRSAARGADVYSPGPPCQRRHSTQWQTLTSRSGPSTS